MIVAYESQKYTGRLPAWTESAEAFDSAVHIGSGATFSVSRQHVYSAQAVFDRMDSGSNFMQLPQLKVLENVAAAHNGSEPSLSVGRHKLADFDRMQVMKNIVLSWMSRQNLSLDKTPKFVAYKTVNAMLQVNGEPAVSDRNALLNAVQELLALTHFPILKHPYVVNFLGLAWSRMEGTELRLPVIITEFAEHGNLAAMLRNNNLNGIIKRRLSLDIALGIQCLHECGIVHGDMKMENVLIFSGNDRPFVAKLADFGFSTLGDEWPSFLAGTWPWTAPEVELGAVSVPKLTDVFSYGLLVWSIALNGHNPFDFIDSVQMEKERSVRIAILKQKQNGRLLELAIGGAGIKEAKRIQLRYLSERYGPSVKEKVEEVFLAISRIQSVPHGAGTLLNPLPTHIKESFADLLSRESRSFYFAQLPKIFEVTLQPDPHSRSLEKAIRIMDTHDER